MPGSSATPDALPTRRVDFVFDFTCPWCAIGLVSLEQAIASLAGTVEVELHLQSFELNPGLTPEGEAIADYARRKYGATAAELAARQALIRARAAEVGLDFALRSHVYGSFDAHRLQRQAALEGRSLELARALFIAYHQRRENLAQHPVLLHAAAVAGLDPRRAADVLAHGDHADVVRAQVRQLQRRGITSVPTLIVDGRIASQGAQPAAVLERLLRRAEGL